MAGVLGVNGGYNSLQKKVTGKITFEIGENISARITSRSEDGKTIMIRTLDGWVFPALLEEPLEFLPEMLLRLQVSGYEDGKVKLKIIPLQQQEGDAQEEDLAAILKSNSLSEEDRELLNKMIKYSLPLTRENISKIKSLANFLEKINLGDEEQLQFISKYINGKNISQESQGGKEIKNLLQDFFKEIKTLSMEDIMFMNDNNIELTVENIRSFKNITKEGQGLQESLKFLEDKIKSNINENKLNILTNDGFKDIFNNSSTEYNVNKASYSEGETEFFSQIKNKSIEQQVLKFDNIKQDLRTNLISVLKEKASQLNKTEADNIERYINSDSVDNIVERVMYGVDNNSRLESLGKKGEFNGKLREAVEYNFGKENFFQEKDIKDIVKILEKKYVVDDYKENIRNSLETTDVITKEVRNKIDNIKSIIQSIIDLKGDMKEDAWKGIEGNLKNNINDIKVFNSISGQYYYMDIPLTVHQKDYPCKLIIKDDRKQGKKIDSTNVKMALSITTINMGVVDAYVSVKEKNMQIDFKCEEKWVQILGMAKEKLWQLLSHSGYNININVDKKVVPLDIVNCRDFFQDQRSTNINTVV